VGHHWPTILPLQILFSRDDGGTCGNCQRAMATARERYWRIHGDASRRSCVGQRWRDVRLRQRRVAPLVMVESHVCDVSSMRSRKPRTRWADADGSSSCCSSVSTARGVNSILETLEYCILFCD
jgi:hypothetical protein